MVAISILYWSKTCFTSTFCLWMVFTLYCRIFSLFVSLVNLLICVVCRLLFIVEMLCGMPIYDAWICCAVCGWLLFWMNWFWVYFTAAHLAEKGNSRKEHTRGTLNKRKTEEGYHTRADDDLQQHSQTPDHAERWESEGPEFTFCSQNLDLMMQEKVVPVLNSDNKTIIIYIAFICFI